MINSQDFFRFKGDNRLAMVTAYDYAFAHAAESAGIDIILVGDSLANVVLGLKSTRQVDMAIMEIFVGAAARGAPSTHIIGDMPWGSCTTPQKALENARRFLDCGAHSVKIEGCHQKVISLLINNHIPVVGHLGLLPQTATSFKKAGTSEAEGARILKEAQILESLGICCLILEHIPADLASNITQTVKPPTVGIGAGPHCNGQVLVMHDMLGMHTRKLPPFVHKFADILGAATVGLKDYADAVRQAKFPV